MNLFYRRPLALFCFLFAAASICGCFLDTAWKYGIVAACALTILILAILCICLKPARARLLAALLCLLFVASAFLSTATRIDRPNDIVAAHCNEQTEMEMKIERVVSSTSFSSTLLVDITVDEVPVRALLSCDYPTDFSAGDVILGAVTIVSVGEVTDSVQYYKARDVFTALVSSSEEPVEQIREESLSLGARLNALNQLLATRISDVVGGDTADLLIALVLGNRDYLSPSVSRDFNRLGLSHLLAISGMHLSVFLLILDTLLRKLRIRKGARSVTLLLVALFYLALTGFSLSTVRAFIMVTFVYAAFLSGQQNDAVTSLFFALFLILSVSPCAVWDVGLWMSFLAVLGILVGQYFTEKIREALHKSRLRTRAERVLAAILSAVVVSFFANVFVCLPLSLCFDALPLLTVATTLIVSPLVTVLLFFAPLVLMAASLSAFAYFLPLLGIICKPICEAILFLVGSLSKLSDITVSLRLPFAFPIVILAAIALFILLVVPLRHKIWIPVVPLVAALAFTGALIHYNAENAERLTIDYLGGGESEMLVLTTANDAVICDLSSGANAYFRDAVALATERYQTEISAVVYTHYHARHVTTLAKNAERYVIRAVYLPYPENEDEYFVLYSFADAARVHGIPLILFDRNEPLTPAPNVTLNLSSPVYLKRSTHPTFTISVSAFDKTLLYVAESAHESLALFETVSQTAADYVILGTHGPITKVSYSYPSLAEAKAVFVADSNVIAYMNPATVAETELIFGSDRITLNLTP